MTPRDRIKRYTQIGALAAALLWALLCFLIILSPRLRKLDDVSQQVAASGKELAQMNKEIEDARIIGGPPTGQARFDKFGILSTDEEQLFLTDLIAFCKDTTNTLNLVRRSEFSQTAITSTTATGQGGRQGQGGASQSQAPASEANQPPQPVILRVPHTVSFSGTFLSAFYLLRQLESYRRLLTVERMDLATDTQAGYPRISGNITIELYLVKQPAATPTVQAGQARPTG